jgi:hypothetical protein
MFIPNHPKINVLQDVARSACALRGLDLPDTPPPVDFQALRMIWPVYPELAAAQGLQGDMTFRRGISSPPLELEDIVERFYSLYERAGGRADALVHPRVLSAVERLQAAGV